MGVDLEERNKIRRLYYVDHYTINAISETLGVHHSTIKRAIKHETFSASGNLRKTESYWDQFKNVIEDHLKEHPKLTSTRLFQLLTDRGATQQVSSLRSYVRKIRPKHKEAFIKRKPLPGEEAQVDWGVFGEISINGAIRPLYCFVMVLSWSRKTFACFTLDMKTETFFSCHNIAFEYFQSVPRVILYDNLKSVVNDRHGGYIRFNAQALEFSGHYNYELRPCNPYRGNEKGIVERKIRFIRENFFAARKIENFESLNKDMAEWLKKVANQYPWPDNKDHKIEAKFIEEQPRLLKLPSNILTPERSTTVKCGKYPFIRFDKNHYSVPYQHVQRALLVQSTSTRIRIYDNGKLIAEHPRVWGKEQEIVNPLHHEELKDFKRRATEHLKKSSFIQEYPLLEKIINSNMDGSTSITKLLEQMRDLENLYGSALFTTALTRMDEEKRHTIQYLSSILQKLSDSSKLSPHIPLRLPNKPEIRDLSIIHNNLDQYDQI